MPKPALSLVQKAFTEAEWKHLQKFPEFVRAVKRLKPGEDPNHVIVGGSLLLIKKGRFEVNVSVELPKEKSD